MKATTYAVAPRPSADEKRRSANVFDVSSRQSGSSSVDVVPSSAGVRASPRSCALMSARIIEYERQVAPVFAASAAATGGPGAPVAASHAPRYVDAFGIAHARPISRKQYAESKPISAISAPAGSSVERVGASAHAATPAGDRNPPQTMFLDRLSTETERRRARSSSRRRDMDIVAAPDGRAAPTRATTSAPRRALGATAAGLDAPFAISSSATRSVMTSSDLEVRLSHGEVNDSCEVRRTSR